MHDPGELREITTQIVVCSIRCGDKRWREKLYEVAMASRAEFCEPWGYYCTRCEARWDATDFCTTDPNKISCSNCYADAYFVLLVQARANFVHWDVLDATVKIQSETGKSIRDGWEDR